MNDEQYSLVRIIRFEARDAGSSGVFLRPEETGEPKLLGLFPGKQEGI
jgi:hypothetical protein